MAGVARINDGDRKKVLASATLNGHRFRQFRVR